MSKKYWSKRKRYGWGWVPTSWQLWTIIGIWLVFILWATFFILQPDEESTETLWIYLTLVFMATVPLILISYNTGPKPKWCWGKKPDDDPDLDY